MLSSSHLAFRGSSCISISHDKKEEYTASYTLKVLSVDPVAMRVPKGFQAIVRSLMFMLAKGIMSSYEKKTKLMTPKRFKSVSGLNQSAKPNHEWLSPWIDNSYQNDACV